MSIDNEVAGLLEGGAKSAKFPTVGTSVKGTIEAARVTDQTDLNGVVKIWADGTPRKQIVVTLLTDEREEDDDDGRRALYVKGNMLSAVREALKKAGTKNLEVGARLAVRYESDGVQDKPGHNPPKIYVAAYEAPKASPVGVDDLL